MDGVPRASGYASFRRTSYLSTWKVREPPAIVRRATLCLLPSPPPPPRRLNAPLRHFRSGSVHSHTRK